MQTFARIASFVSIYGGTLGFLYLWGYWKRFGVNFLEFANLTDLIRLSVMPIVASSLLVLALNVVTQLIDPISRYTERVQQTTPKPRNFRHYILPMILLVGLAYAVWRILAKDEPLWWFYLGGVASVWAPLRMKEDGLDALIFPNTAESTRSIFAFALVALPFISFGAGATRAKAVDDGAAWRGYADVAAWNGGPVSVRGHRYLGTLGQFAFFWTADDAVLIAEWSKIAPLELRHSTLSSEHLPLDRAK